MLISTEVDALRIFADPLRTRIVELLSQEQLCTTHLVDETGARQPTVSHHLRILREAGLVETEPCGRFNYYRLVPDALEEMADHLRELATAARAAREIQRPC
jgi:ArsR family transcriptional regulator, arsenate/arsenite/antimonite-responsive transcriptional repressor